jgi:hypothetical protein
MMKIAPIVGLASAFACIGCIATAQVPQLRTYELSTTGCATEGGEVTVLVDGGSIRDWKGSFCISTGCATFEISDIADDGSLTLKAEKTYVDGGELSYSTKVHRGTSTWEHNTPMTLDHGEFIEADLRSVQALFELSGRAVADGKTELQCN